MQTLLQDLRYAMRQLRNAPGFAFTAIVTLALGIGATIGVYTLVDAILLRPLPYRDPSRLFVLKDGDSSVTLANLEQLKARSQGRITSAALVDEFNGQLEIAGRRSPVLAVESTANLMSVLGVQPALGRDFREDENDPGKTHVLLLSDSVWRSSFNADPLVVGKIATLLGEVYTVIGVMPHTFAMPMDSVGEVWTPAILTAANRTTFQDKDDKQNDALVMNLALIHPSPGVDAAQMRADLTGVQRQIVAENKILENHAELTATDYLTMLSHDAQKPLLLLLGVGASFWLLAALNVTGLLVARAMAREREFAVRSALGASRVRLLRQSMMESLLISAAGSALGLVLATVAIKFLWHSITRSLPLTDRIHIEPHVWLALIGISLLTGIAAGLLPALRASGRNVQNGLRGGAAPMARADQHRLRSGLVAAQLMITVILLAGAGLFLRTVTALRAVPLGFAQQNVLTGGIIRHAGTPLSKSPNTTGIAQRVYLPLLAQVNHMPGVESASLSSVMPMRSEFEITMIGKIDGKISESAAPYQAAGRAASPGLPETFGIPMLRGRFFAEQDTPTSPAVVVVNQAFANAYLAGKDPLGHTFGLSKGRFEAMQIIGVIGDVKQGAVTHSTRPEVYLCLAQVTPDTPFYEPVTAFMQVGIRGRIPAQLLRKQFELALEHVDPDAQTINVKTIHEAVEDSFGSQTLMAHLLEGFSGMALLIALVGLYGTVAFSVAQRAREFGVRLALGAPQESIRRLVVSKAMWPVLAGLVAGDAVLWFATRLISSYLFGVAPHDTLTIALASLLLVATGLAASLIPARRAAAIDPMQALRTE